MATFPNYIPSANSQQADSIKQSRYEFGDGYTQRVLHGLNSLRRVWSCTFKLLSDADLDVIRGFLEARNGVEAFDWTPPYGAAGKWTCPEWNIVHHEVTHTLSCKFLEEFDI